MRQVVYVLKTVATTRDRNGKTYAHRVDLIQGSWAGEQSLILKIAGTRGQWYLSTLFGTDGYGRGVGTVISIDMGQNWDCINMDQIMAEVESLFGTVLNPVDYSAILVAGVPV